VTQTGPIGDREPLKDVARNLDRWTQGIVARVFFQRTIDELAQWSSVPVINALSDLYHPCQALADVLTIKERFGRLEGLKVAFIGDGNNVAHSLMLTCVRLGANFALATPESYEANRDIIAQTREIGSDTGATVSTGHDAAAAVEGAHVVYTDVWTSMGQESEGATRRQAFGRYQVNGELFGRARQDAVFMHCLPAKRGQETTDDVMEHPNSVIFDQAENRLHAQKALLLMLLA
jgi:ornithine carbamoyltransferase